MGLAIETGILADLICHDPEGADELRECFTRVNEVLAENRLPPHQEPEQLPAQESRAGLCSFSYSFLHHLRRVYARATDDPGWQPTPTPADEDAAEDPAIDEVTCLMTSHLLCHSDCEGFYLPIHFTDVVVDDRNQERIPGGFLGSSYRLQEELVMVAPILGIKLDRGALSDAEADRINRDADSETDWWIELIVWISLFEAARLSIEHQTAICFC
ncbi:MAG: hypothetical protein JSS02_11735 [Planctomycetes bacterium]|nr:hypothetical protein [Planctomycetota bacterium]